MNRREMLQLGAGVVWAAYASAAPGSVKQVETWDTYEVELHGPSAGNPFTEVTLSGRFHLEHRTVEVTGFYDGDGVYRIRFMPDAPGQWTWESASSHSQLQGAKGSFLCVPASGTNHGPVGAAHQFHFQYADGTPFFPFGTTCYACAFMGPPYEEQTIETLRTTAFNKVRLCLLPKTLGHEIFALPFVQNDLTRLNPVYFQHVEKRIGDLRQIGIQADVILFHPYISPPGTPVWSDGGRLMGTSLPRLTYLRSLVESITKTGLNEYEGSYYPSAGQPGELYLYYFDMHCVGEYDFPLPAGIDFKCALIDPWNMTSRDLPGVFRSSGKERNVDPGEKQAASQSRVTLTGKPYMAALFQRV